MRTYNGDSVRRVAFSPKKVGRIRIVPQPQSNAKFGYCKAGNPPLPLQEVK